MLLRLLWCHSLRILHVIGQVKLVESLEWHASEFIDIELIVPLGPASRVRWAYLRLVAMDLITNAVHIIFIEGFMRFSWALSIVLNLPELTPVIEEMLQWYTRITLIAHVPLKVFGVRNVLHHGLGASS